MRLELHGVDVEVTAQWQLVGDGCGSNTADPAHRVHGLVKETGTRTVAIQVVTCLLHLHGEQV